MMLRLSLEIRGSVVEELFELSMLWTMYFRAVQKMMMLDT